MAPEDKKTTATAKLMHAKVSPQKVRLLLDLIRGKMATEALSILKFSRRPVARDLTKLLSSAVANAEETDVGRLEDLVVARAYADVGPSLKRIRPAPMGRAFRYLHRTSHITVMVQAFDSEVARPRRRKAAAGKRGR